MSLWFNVHVNLREIGSLEIKRVTNMDRAVLHADETADYEWTAMDYSLSSPRPTWSGKVEGHRYGDGSWVLIRAAVDDLLRQQVSA